MPSSPVIEPAAMDPETEEFLADPKVRTSFGSA